MKFTKEEEIMIVDFYERKKDVIESSSKVADAQRRKREVWEECATLINSRSSTKKTPIECKKKWQNIKFKSKMSNAARKRSQNETGGGPPEKEDPVVEKVIDMIGETPSFSGLPGGIESEANQNIGKYYDTTHTVKYCKV